MVADHKRRNRTPALFATEIGLEYLVSPPDRRKRHGLKTNLTRGFAIGLNTPLVDNFCLFLIALKFFFLMEHPFSRHGGAS
jgi:hypothetical protein